MEKIKAKSSFKEISTVLDITRSIIATLDYEKVLQIISDGMSDLLGIETAAIYILENDDKLYLGATTPALPPDFPDQFRVANMIDHPSLLKSVITKKALVINDTSLVELSPAEKAVTEMRNIRSLLFLPFIHDEMVLGVLILGTCNVVRIFSDNEIDLGQTIANQLAIAIENTRLHNDIKLHKENLEQQIEKKTKNLNEALQELKIVNNVLQLKNNELEKTIQHLHETEAQLVQSEKMASLGILTAGIAHEINNPLNFIMGSYVGLSNYFQRNQLNADKSVSVFMESLKTGLDNASNIVQSLNSFSRGTTTFDEKCDLQNIIENCLLMLNSHIKGKIELIRNYHYTPALVKGNTGKLHQVFLNLILNGVQSISNEGTITITIVREEGNIVVDIKDTGIGIDEKQLKKICDPFYTTKAPGQGTGLGLYIVYSIVAEHGGDVKFESILRKGTIAKVYLPEYS